MGLGLMGAVTSGAKQIAGLQSIDGGTRKDGQGSAVGDVIKKWHDDPIGETYNALDRGGVIGILGEYENTLDKAGLPTVHGTLGAVLHKTTGLGDGKTTEGSRRFQSSGIVQAMGGPTAGALDDARAGLTGLSHIFQYMSGMQDANKPFERKDFNSARRLIPGQNLPVLQQMINAGEQHLGSALGWPTGN